MEMELQAKYERLLEYMREFGCAVIGFSGGVDSTFLLYAAHEALGNRCHAVTIRSVLGSKIEMERIERLVEKIGAPHRFIDVDVFDIEHFAENPQDRCYYCKTVLFGKIKAAAQRMGGTVMDGSNTDDAHDVRPGRKAIRELGVRSPLEEQGWSKEQIRQASKALGLETWDIPSMACLASRIPYGEVITPDKLRSVESAEDALRSLGIGQLRVRHHGDIARIEALPQDFELVMQNREVIVNACREAGFRFAALDLHGFQSGSLNRRDNKQGETIHADI